jgi:hypothetical protein
MATTSPKRPLELSADAVEEGPVTKKARVDDAVEEEQPKRRFRCVIKSPVKQLDIDETAPDSALVYSLGNVRSSQYSALPWQGIHIG